MPVDRADHRADHPEPFRGRGSFGPVPLRGYALASSSASSRDLDRRAALGRPGRRLGTVADLAVWAVPFGLVGGRLYHVLTDSQLYFGDGGSPIEALYDLARRPRRAGGPSRSAPSG